MQIAPEEFRTCTGITIAACGTSWHSGLAGKFMIERLARLPVDVDYASEYRYRDPIPDASMLGLLITQSGETADTIAAQQELIRKGSKTLAICNVVGAAITRAAQGTITTNAGPEIGVASTKAFTAQLTALFVFSLYLAQQRKTVSAAESLHYVTELSPHPRQDRNHPALRRRPMPATGEVLLGRQRLPFPRPRHPLPHRARGRAQAEGDQLHPRRGLSRRRDEARPQRAHRRDPARSLHRHPRPRRSIERPEIRKNPSRTSRR